MSRYKSKYTGAQIDDSLTRVLTSGIGSQAVFLNNGENLDTIWKAGFYAWDTNAVNIPCQYGSMIVFNKGGNYVVCQLVADLNGTMFFRTAINNVWSEWEYVNPPMQPGVEYRTTERFNGHPVYTKLFNSEALPAVGTSKIITFAGDADAREVYRCISVIAVVGALSYSGGWALTAPNTAAMEVSGGYNTVKIVSNIDFSPVSGTADIIVKYWKTTD